MPQLSPPARARSELLRQLWHAAERRDRRRSSSCSADATRVPVVTEMTIGRAPGATLVLSDPSVSRVHARISADAVLEDAGSSHGTWLDGVRVTGPSPLHDGAQIRLGDAELRVERRREVAEAGRTIVVRAGASLLVPSVGPAGGLRRRSSGCARGCARATRSSGSTRPRAASAGCCATSRPARSCGCRTTTRALFELLDGSHSLVELVGLRRAALRRDRAGAAGAAADRPRRARVPGRRGRRAAAGARSRRGACGGCSSRARRCSSWVGPFDREALPRRAAGCSSRAPC